MQGEAKFFVVARLLQLTFQDSIHRKLITIYNARIRLKLTVVFCLNKLVLFGLIFVNEVGQVAVDVAQFLVGLATSQFLPHGDATQARLIACYNQVCVITISVVWRTEDIVIFLRCYNRCVLIKLSSLHFKLNW